jgi:TetR/AcrR family transcriptional regulator
VTVPAILAAAQIEFATNSFAAARTESIDARANVVMGLIIHYFKSKEGLYEAVLVQAYQPLRAALNQSSSDQTSAPRTLC